jgi:hypothetical protein
MIAVFSMGVASLPENLPEDTLTNEFLNVVNSQDTELRDIGL